MRVFSKSKSPERSETVNLPKRVVTAESKGQLSPELSPIVTLLSAQSHRRYYEGVFMLLKDLDSEGKPADRQWNEVYGALTGNQLAVWDAAEVLSSIQDNDPSVLEKHENKPTYINFTDATFKAVNSIPSIDSELKNVIIISTTLKNRFLIQISSNEAFTRWNAAFRLAAYEYKALQEAYTAALLSARGALLSDIRVILAETKFTHEDWVSVRFGAGMPWKRCFAVIEPSKKAKKGVAGKVHFYENEKKTKKLAMATIIKAYSLYAVYPQSYKVIDQSTMIKLDGEILFDKKDAPKDASIFLMPEVHSSVPGYDTLIRFIVPLMDIFRLYGRPKKLNADKTDKDSLLFSLPVLPKVHYLEVDDLLALSGSSTTSSWSAVQWNDAIKDVLRAKIVKGYTGCGSTSGLSGAVNVLSTQRDISMGKIKNFSSDSPITSSFLPSPSLPHQGTFDSSAPSMDERLDLNSNANQETRVTPPPSTLERKQPTVPILTPENANDDYFNPMTPDNNSDDFEFGNSNPSPKLVDIYRRYAQIGTTSDVKDINDGMNRLSFSPPANGTSSSVVDSIDDLYPGADAANLASAESDDDDSDEEVVIVKPNTRSRNNLSSKDSLLSEDTTHPQNLRALYPPSKTVLNSSYAYSNSSLSQQSTNSQGAGSAEALDRPISIDSLTNNRVLSPYSEFHKEFNNSMKGNVAYGSDGLSSSPNKKPLPTPPATGQQIRYEELPSDADGSRILPKQRVTDQPQKLQVPQQSENNAYYTPSGNQQQRAPSNNIIPQKVAYSKPTSHSNMQRSASPSASSYYSAENSPMNANFTSQGPAPSPQHHQQQQPHSYPSQHTGNRRPPPQSSQHSYNAYNAPQQPQPYANNPYQQPQQLNQQHYQRAQTPPQQYYSSQQPPQPQQPQRYRNPPPPQANSQFQQQQQQQQQQRYNGPPTSQGQYQPMQQHSQPQYPGQFPNQYPANQAPVNQSTQPKRKFGDNPYTIAASAMKGKTPGANPYTSNPYGN